MNSIQDTYTLNNGVKIPCCGFGTYKTKDGDGTEIIERAIQCGYRFFDTASIYETEFLLGQAIRNSKIPREEFVILSKLWIDEMGYENTKRAFAASLERLRTDYLDLYLIHWPRPNTEDPDWKELDLETWRALEELYDQGKIRALGCSNFLPHHLENLLVNARVKPAVDQLEIHPGYSQEAAVAYCLEQGIRPMAWAPLGRFKENPVVNGALEQMEKKYKKSVAQICLRFALEKGIIPIPKASSPEHMKSNMDIFDFSMSREDVSILSCMPQTAWIGQHPDFVTPDKKSNPDQSPKAKERT